MKIVNYFFLALGLGITLLIIGVIYINHHVNFDPTKVDKVTGKVIKTGVVILSPRNRQSGPTRAFSFDLDNLNTQLGTYRPNDDYSRLIREIQIGDTVTVYFLNHQTHSLNIDVYQIEKNGKVIQDYQSYKRNHKKLIVLLGLFAYCIILYSIAKTQLKKHSNQH